MIEKTPQVEQQPQQEELDYQTNDPNRMAQISSNLDLAYQQTPTLFKDRATFEENFDYEERSDAQKLLLDDFFNRKEKENMLKVTPVEEMVRAIASGKTSI